MKKFYVTLFADMTPPWGVDEQDYAWPVVYVIKWLRYILGCGLKEAKDLADEMRSTGNVEHKAVIIVNEEQLLRLMLAMYEKQALGAQYMLEYGLNHNATGAQKYDVMSYIRVTHVAASYEPQLRDFTEPHVVKAPAPPALDDRYPF